MTTPDSVSPIRKELILAIAPERAFRLFTAEIDRWWPLATHSVEGEEAAGVSVDGRVGGVIAESGTTGRRHIWGTIQLWDPPRRFVTTWHPGRPAAEPTELEVRFEPWEGGTRLVLEHRGWDRGGWTRGRASYESGWDRVLDRFLGLAR